MQDRIVEYPNRYLIVPAEGDLADLIPVPGEVLQAGTPLNKASLLSDATAAALGLTDADPTVDGALAALNGKFRGRAATFSGSYTGTGAYGADSPCRLTFAFDPMLVFVTPYDVSYGNLLIMLRGAAYAPNFDIQSQTAGGTYVNTGYYGMRVVWSTNNNVSWYHSGSASLQMNVQGTRYLYTALGVME